ncbi:MAG: hypothetical protein LBF51_03450 [Zoogloeaceae bacterium]|jgi:hypothetical protein|nr:hypothetical protein [Zoogloeaceae bacterium]
MKRLLMFFLCLSLPILAPSSAVAAEFASEEDFAQWLTGYYRHPEPARVSEAFRYAAANGLLQEPAFGMLFTGFIAGVFRDNPEKVPAWQAEWLRLDAATANSEADDDDDRAARGRANMIFFALWYAEHPELRQMARALEEKNDDLKFLAGTIRDYHENARSLEDIPINQGEWVVRALWGKFYATGEVAALERTLQALPWEKYPDSAEYGNQPLGTIFAPQQIGRAAHWMLSDAAYLNPQMLERCKAFLEKTRDAAIAEALRSIIAEVTKAKAAAAP